MGKIKDTKVKPYPSNGPDSKIKKLTPEEQRKLKAIHEGFLEALRNAGDDGY